MEQVMVSAAGGCMGSVLGKLNGLLEKEYKQLKGVGGDIRILRDELSSMHALLKKFDKLENPDDQIKEWMRQVRELSYDVEDCIDEFMHHLRQNDIDIRGFIPKIFHMLRTLKDRYEIGNQIQDLKARVHEVSERRKRYKLDTVDTSSSSYVPIDPRLPAFYAEATRLVGIDGPRDELINWLQGDGKKLKVLAIVGCGGLGKTTLVMEVYRKHRSQFACRASVTVSQRFDHNKVLTDILSQVHSNKIDRSKWNDGELFRELQEYLSDKRYFIVIDDIWSESAWEIIKCALPENNCGSRIITTTRIVTVAQSCCDGCDGRVHEIQPLNRPNSESLFFRRIFGSEDSCPSNLKEVSDAILKKCGGMPLAIASVASLLASTPRAKEQWERIRNSIGSPAGTDSQLEKIKQILSFSYNNLPLHLKTCLLYLSIFPEDYVIRKSRLVRRWIAEGFIVEGCTLHAEDIAKSYFNELVNRSMLQPVFIQYDGRVRSCRVHDMVLDLLVSKSTEQNFVTPLHARQSIVRLQGMARRLSLHHYDHREHDAMLLNLCHARSLTVFGQVGQMPPIHNFKVLRVLDLEDWQGLENFDLTNIERLFQLKYLSLRGTDIRSLPARIGELQYLRTLNLRWTAIRELPTSVVQLRCLEHLRLDCLVLPKGFGKMRALRRLDWIDVSCWSPGAMQELGDLTNLRVLKIRLAPTGDDGRYEGSLVSSLIKLGSHNLQSLSIGVGRPPWERTQSVFLESWSPPPLSLQKLKMDTNSMFLPRVPEWMRPLTNLSRLEIRVGELWEEDLQLLGSLPALLVLELSSDKECSEDPMIVFRSNAFQCLKEIIFSPSVLCPTFEPGAMPKLEEFSSTFPAATAKSMGFRFGIEHLLCLEGVYASIYCEGAEHWEVEATEAAITNACNIHPNHPTIGVDRLG